MPELPPRPHNGAFDRSCCRTNIDQPHDRYCVEAPPPTTTVMPVDPALVAQVDQKAAETGAAIDRLVHTHCRNLEAGVPATESLLALTTGIDHGWNIGRPELCGLLAVAVDRLARAAMEPALEDHPLLDDVAMGGHVESPATMDAPRSLGEHIEPWHGKAGGFDQ